MIEPHIDINDKDELTYTWGCVAFDRTTGKQNFCEGSPRMKNSDTQSFLVASNAWLPN